MMNHQIDLGALQANNMNCQFNPLWMNNIASLPPQNQPSMGECDPYALNSFIPEVFGDRKQPAAKKAKKPTKFKKAPGAPRRFKSAFIFFSTNKHREIRENMKKSGQIEKTTNVAKMVSEAWKSLCSEDRAVWEEKARLDRVRYEVEVANYKGPWKVPARRAKKDPKAPKRPMSAFLSFSNKQRMRVMQENPNFTQAEVSGFLAKMWREAPEHIRSSYIGREQEQREQYKVAIAAWRKEDKIKKDAKREERESEAMEVAKSYGGDATSSVMTHIQKQRVDEEQQLKEKVEHEEKERKEILNRAADAEKLRAISIPTMDPLLEAAKKRIEPPQSNQFNNSLTELMQMQLIKQQQFLGSTLEALSKMNTMQNVPQGLPFDSFNQLNNFDQQQQLQFHNQFNQQLEQQQQQQQQQMPTNSDTIIEWADLCSRLGL